MDSPQEEALFGRWLRKRRRALDLTQKLLARRVGCSPATIRKLEADERRPSRHVARELAAALGVPEPEHDAFVRFARGGWADVPPAGAGPDLERPWRVGVSVAAHEPETDDASGAASHGAPERRAAADQQGEVHAPHHGAVSGGPRVLAREAQLERLDRELERALAGGGRTVLISGEAGQGKSALMAAFAARAQATHAELLVAEGTCNAYTGRGDPFLPFRQILAQLTGDVGTTATSDAYERERADRLRRVMPRSARRLTEHGPHLLDSLVPARALAMRLERAGVTPPPILASAAAPTSASFQRSAERGQDALRAETVATLTAIADETPLLVLLDDLHWLDDSSAELLLHLASAAGAHAVLLVGAHRPGGRQDAASGRILWQALDELARSHATTVDLDRADGRAFVEAWIDSEANALDAGFRAALLRQTGGHPLFTIELLRAMQERGDLVRDGDGRWSAAGDLRWDRLPARIADALAARIGRLDTAARNVLRAASVEGETFTAEVAAAVLELDPRQVVGTLGADLDGAHRLVAAVDVQRGPAGLLSRYRFRHNLIQRYVYDGIAASERAYLHESVAAALERLHGEDADPVALAMHFTLARAPDRAAVHHRKAGDQARNSHAFDQAIEHYRAAVEHWPDPDPLSRAALQRALGECQEVRLQLDDARRNLDEARAAFEEAGDMRAAGSTQLSLADVSVSQLDYARAADEHRRAVAMLEPLGDSAELASALHGLAYYHGLHADFAGGMPIVERSMAMADRVGADAVLAHAMGSVGAGLARLYPERREEALHLLERGFRLADELGEARIACQVSFNLADVLNGIGRYREARDRFAACLAYARQHQDASAEHSSQRSLFRLAWAHGEWEDAFARLPHMRRLYEGTGPLRFDVWDLATDLASHDLDLGRHEQARAMLDKHWDALRRLPRPGERIPGLGAHLRATARSGRHDEADRDAAAIADAVTPEPPYEYDIIGAVLQALRHLLSEPGDQGRARASACLHALERLERQYGSPEAKAALLEARAMTAETDEAASLFTQAAEHWRAGTFPLHEARARAAAARALDREGRDADAVAERERARTLLAGLAAQIPTAELRESFGRATGAMLADGAGPERRGA